MITLKDEFESVLNTSIQPYRWDAMSRIIERHVKERTADLQQRIAELEKSRYIPDEYTEQQDTISNLFKRIAELEAQLQDQQPADLSKYRLASDKRKDDIWEDLGNTLRDMGEEEPP